MTRHRLRPRPVASLVSHLGLVHRGSQFRPRAIVRPRLFDNENSDGKVEGGGAQRITLMTTPCILPGRSSSRSANPRGRAVEGLQDRTAVCLTSSALLVAPYVSRVARSSGSSLVIECPTVRSVSPEGSTPRCDGNWAPRAKRRDPCRGSGCSLAHPRTAQPRHRRPCEGEATPGIASVIAGETAPVRSDEERPSRCSRGACGYLGGRVTDSPASRST